MILGDVDILAALEAGDITIDPFDRLKLGPCSYDVTLGDEIKYYPRVLDGASQVIDPFVAPEMRSITMSRVNRTGLLLRPGQLYLGHTAETIGTGLKYVADIGGKSSLARLGLMIHVSAGFGDPGWSGHFTCEFGVIGDRSIRVYPGQDIAQIRFTQVSRVANGYTGRYNGQTGATESRYHINRNKPE